LKTNLRQERFHREDAKNAFGIGFNNEGTRRAQRDACGMGENTADADAFGMGFHREGVKPQGRRGTKIAPQFLLSNMNSKRRVAEGAEVAAQCFGSQKTRKGSEVLNAEYMKTSTLATLNFVSIFIIS